MHFGIDTYALSVDLLDRFLATLKVCLEFFGEISSISRDMNNRNKLYIFDSTNYVVKLIDESLNQVSTLYQYQQPTTNFAMKFNHYNGKLYIANSDDMREHDVRDFTQNKQIMRGEGYRDGGLETALYRQPKDILFLSSTAFVFTDYEENK